MLYSVAFAGLHNESRFLTYAVSKVQPLLHKCDIKFSSIYDELQPPVGVWLHAIVVFVNFTKVR